jgi:XTP/dITP diphosphohydrolase
LPSLLLASNNPGKVRELRDLLPGTAWRVVTPADLDLQLEVEESGDTYAENAALKARAFCAAAHMTALADDSGLEVDALDGRPGVHTSRYGGLQATPAAQMQRLLRELRDVPEERRTARFRCVIAIATPDGRLVEIEGICEGRIADSPRGASGFGYDPIFLVPERSLTLAELSSVEKHRISHRGRAMRRAVAVLAVLGCEFEQR